MVFELVSIQVVIMEDKKEINEKYVIAVKQRGVLRAKVTRQCIKIETSFETYSSSERSSSHARLTSLQTDLGGLDKEILNLGIKLGYTDESLEAMSIDDEVYEEKICRCLSLLTVSQPTSILNSTPHTNGSHSFESVAPHRLTLPKVNLPTFSNEPCENIIKFFRSFEAIVGKHNLSDYEKFIYLKNQLRNAPLILVESLDVDQQSYQTAKNLLNEAFDSKLTSKFDIIKVLTQLKLSKNEDPYNFIGNMRTVTSNVKSLNITIDDVIHYFVWTGLNMSFQSHLTQITNKSRPSLVEIEENIFEATARYCKQLEKNRENKSIPPKTDYNNISNRLKYTATNAINVQNNKLFCGLCKTDNKNFNHSMGSCEVYKTSKERFDKLRKINGCTRCSFINHPTNKCQFQFRSKCRYCGGGHMSYLCLKPKSSDNAEDDRVEESNSCLLFTEAFNLNVGKTILPTFKANLRSDKYNLPVKILKDSGSSHTFICSSIAEALNLPVVKRNVPLMIHGFNSSRTVRTKLVKVSLQIGGKMYSHEALCIDRIRTEFAVDQFQSVVSGFISKKYRIADTDYLDSKVRNVCNIDLIVGTDLDHVLPMTYKLFGNDSCPDSMSCYIETPIGVMFSGDVAKMRANLKYLPVSEGVGVQLNSVSCSPPRLLGWSPSHSEPRSPSRSSQRTKSRLSSRSRSRSPLRLLSHSQPCSLRSQTRSPSHSRSPSRAHSCSLVSSLSMEQKSLPGISLVDDGNGYGGRVGAPTVRDSVSSSDVCGFPENTLGCFGGKSTRGLTDAELGAKSRNTKEILCQLIPAIEPLPLDVAEEPSMSKVFDRDKQMVHTGAGNILERQHKSVQVSFRNEC